MVIAKGNFLNPQGGAPRLLLATVRAWRRGGAWVRRREFVWRNGGKAVTSELWGPEGPVALWTPKGAFPLMETKGLRGCT
jgi:hypothetical protein